MKSSVSPIALVLSVSSVPMGCGAEDAITDVEHPSSTSSSTTGGSAPTSSNTAVDPPTTGQEPLPDTSGGASTGPAEDTTGGPISGCGDGIVDPGEACDDGIQGNGSNYFCRDNCQINTCGDGDVLLGWELCDEGAANSNSYGSICSLQCTPGARCGDGIVQEEYEQCDLGANNGGEQGDEQGISCDGACDVLALRGFVTSQGFTGDLGGLDGADVKCKDAAYLAGVPHSSRFHAFLSTDEIDANERFAQVAGSLPFVLLTGKKFANSYKDLVAFGPLGEGITIDEHGETLYGVKVATNTAKGGVSFHPDTDCGAWTSADPASKARHGLSGFPEGSDDWQAWSSGFLWTNALNAACNIPGLHLYCLEI